LTVIRTTRSLVAGAAVALAAAALAIATPAGATPAKTAAPRPVTAGSNYLALGDSISFGYREATNTPTPDYTKATNFKGYPERVASALGLSLANVSCPGETSASLNNAHRQSFACETDASGNAAGGYRTNFPLHVKYAGSQLVYGVHYLRAHPNTRLVTLMIGANDGFLCQAQTTDGCMSVSELEAVEAKIEKNVAYTLGKIRTQAHYTGQIVVLNYYSTDYTKPLNNLQSEAINNALDTGAANYNVTIADGYKAFKYAAAQAGGDTCAAGLLTTLSGGGCGVHPSIAGQAVLAGAVESAIKK
jgi:lysophospholipase L1-like esterase